MALEKLTRKNQEKARGVLNQIANNELATEVAPYLKDRPLAQIGFDASRVSMLPTWLPEDHEKYRRWHPKDYLYGEYTKPGRPGKKREKRAWKKALLDAYGITEDQFDRMFVYRHPIHKDQQSREFLLRTLAHEAEHRGRRILDDTEMEKENAAADAMDALRANNPDTWYRDPEYDRLSDIRFPPKGRPTRVTSSHRADEIATRISDILTATDLREKSSDLRHLKGYFLSRKYGKGINPKTYEPYRNPHNEENITVYFDPRPLLENPKTGYVLRDPKTDELMYDEGPKYGKQIPLETYKRLLNYEQEKRAAEKWLKARRGNPRDELIKRLMDE